MASKIVKRTTVVNAENLAKAIHLYEYCVGDIYSLDDIARRFVGNPFSALTMSHVIRAIAASMRTTINDALQLLPYEHPVALEGAEALQRVEVLVEFMEACVGDNEYTMSERTAGAALLDLTARIAAALEAAHIAAGHAAQTALNVVKDRASECEEIIGGAYGELPPQVLRVREANIKARTVGIAERERRDSAHAKVVARRARKWGVR